MTDDTLERLKTTIKKAEGYSAELYRDTVGVWTIGYGRAIGRIGISRDEAEMMFTNDLNRTVRGLDLVMPWWRKLDDVRQAALAEMGYQLGIDGVLNFHKMRAALMAKDYQKAADEILDSKWHAQTPRRCERIATMIRAGVYA